MILHISAGMRSISFEPSFVRPLNYKRRNKSPDILKLDLVDVLAIKFSTDRIVVDFSAELHRT